MKSDSHRHWVTHVVMASVCLLQSRMAELDGLCEVEGRQLEEVVREAQEVSHRRAEKTAERKRVEREAKELRLRQRRTVTAVADQAREKTALQRKMEDLVTT